MKYTISYIFQAPTSRSYSPLASGGGKFYFLHSPVDHVSLIDLWNNVTFSFILQSSANLHITHTQNKYIVYIQLTFWPFPSSFIKFLSKQCKPWSFSQQSVHSFCLFNISGQLSFLQHTKVRDSHLNTSAGCFSLITGTWSLSICYLFQIITH